jgi:hypothetical protein
MNADAREGDPSEVHYEDMSWRPGMLVKDSETLPPPLGGLKDWVFR